MNIKKEVLRSISRLCVTNINDMTSHRFNSFNIFLNVNNSVRILTRRIKLWFDLISGIGIF